MTIEFEQSPSIQTILERHRPIRRPGTRVIHLSDPRVLELELAADAARDLADPSVAARLDAGEIATLAVAADITKRERGDDGGLAAAVMRLLAKCDDEVAIEYVLAAISDHGRYRFLLASLPGVVASSSMIAALVEGMQLETLGNLDSMIDVDQLVIRHLDEARRALPLAGGYARDYISTYLVAAMARGMGWTPWVKLFAILFDCRELAAVNAPSVPPERDRYEADKAKRIRKGVWQTILNDDAVRLVARLLLDLEGALAASGPDVRGVYVSRLREAVGDDEELRRAAIEALIWRRADRQRDLALFAATQLTRPEDEQFVRSLDAHPDRGTGYAAAMLVDAVFGVDDRDDWPLPPVVAIADGLFRLQLDRPSDEEPRTWIGDRLLERLIERTVDGEEGLLRHLFGGLAHRFANLDGGLRATALATGAGREARIDLNYRPVDKSEEGKPGVLRDDSDTPPDFSADICLTVDPYLDGRSLGKRATLVQAKRLRLKKPEDPERGFQPSFKLDPKQMDDLSRQTAFSHYLFQCAGLRGRGIPMMPTQLVKDLARYHVSTEAQIPAALVGPASQSFAEWLTYHVLALRTGDPMQELVAKAEGGAGRRPRRLARLGTVEVTLRVGKPKLRQL